VFFYRYDGEVLTADNLSRPGLGCSATPLQVRLVPPSRSKCANKHYLDKLAAQRGLSHKTATFSQEKALKLDVTAAIA